MNSSLIQKLLFHRRESPNPQEAKNENIEISLENGKFDNFVDNGLEAGDVRGGGLKKKWGLGSPTPGRILRTTTISSPAQKKSLIFEIQIF